MAVSIASLIFGAIFLAIGLWLFHVAANASTFTIKLIEGTVAFVFVVLAALFIAGGAGVAKKTAAAGVPGTPAAATSAPPYASAPPTPQMTQVKS